MSWYQEKKSECVKAFEQKVSLSYSLLSSLQEFSLYNVLPLYYDAGFQPTFSERTEMWNKLVQKYRNDGDWEKFALKSIPSSKVHRLGLIRPIEFKFLTEGPVRPDTKSVFTYDMVIPFNNPHHNDKDCVPVKKLPRFFKI